MSNYILLKSNSKLLLLKIPENFCTTNEILKINDNITLDELIRNEQRLNPEIDFSIVSWNPEEKSCKAGHHPLFLSLKQGDYYIVYKQEEVLYVEASGSYSNITILDRKAIIITFSLADIESKLSDDLFIRIHRSVIVNINYVTKFIGNTVYMGEVSFPIGRKYKKALIDRLNLVCGSKKLVMGKI